MNLKELKEYLESFDKGTVFNFGLSNPFSWRGSYDEVAFNIVEEKTSKEDILSKIEMAYTQTFYGYKGGEYRYNEYTQVNYEEDIRSWTDGGYTEEWISKIEGTETYKGPQDRLTKLLFNQ